MPNRSSLRLFVAALLGLPLPLRSQLLTNGDFESPVLGAGAVQEFSTGSTIGGWTVIGAPGRVLLLDGRTTQFGFNFPSQSGAQWLDLTGLGSRTATGVQQTVGTVVGRSYDLSFWVGNTVGGPLGAFGVTSTVEVFVNGSLLTRASYDGDSGTNTLIWREFRQSFTATSSATTLAFLNADPSDDDINGLDSVVLTESTSVVPEPSSTLLTALSVAAVIHVARRRRT